MKRASSFLWPRPVSTVEPLIALAANGSGLACAPDFAIRQQVAEGSLIVVLDDFIKHDGVFRALWPSSRFVARKVRGFVDFLAEHLFPKSSRPAGLEPAPQERRALP